MLRWLASAGRERCRSGAHGSWNMSRVPLCIADGVSIGQSRAIEHYVAKAYGLMGSSLLEEARIDTLSEHAKELKDASREAKTDEEKAAWFATPAEPVLDGKAHRKLQWHLTHIEACVGDDGTQPAPFLILYQICLRNLQSVGAEMKPCWQATLWAVSPR
eukprot:COSAG06_NODE_1684_length_8722_cov_3.925896_15_plen_160_part_00